MEIITVNALLEECKKLKKKGLGDRQVYISRDDEGNGFHPLFYAFQTDAEEVEEEAGTANAVLLG